MRRYTMNVFDGWVYGGTQYTAPELNERLGLPDKLAFQAWFDVVPSDRMITATVEHSVDGRNWVAKPALAFEADLVGGNETYASGYDDGSTPSFRFVRLAIWMGEDGPVRAKIDVTARDVG